MGYPMSELVLYSHVEAGFESFPTENYVDYMNNVMPVPESHIFFLPKRGAAVVCEVDGNRRLWSLRGYASLPSAVSEMRVEITAIEEMLTLLGDRAEPTECKACDRTFAAVLVLTKKKGIRSELDLTRFSNEKERFPR